MYSVLVKSSEGKKSTRLDGSLVFSAVRRVVPVSGPALWHPGRPLGGLIDPAQAGEEPFKLITRVTIANVHLRMVYRRGCRLRRWGFCGRRGRLAGRRGRIDGRGGF